MTHTTFKQNRLERARKEVARLPPGLERAALIKRCRQLETASDMSLWLASAELQHDASTSVAPLLLTAKQKSKKVRLTRNRANPSGRDFPVAARMPRRLIDEVEAWAGKNAINRSDAFRQLVESGLKARRPRGHNNQPKQRAKEMAGEAIDAKSDGGANPDDRANRKRRLIKGPEEFRNWRIDRRQI